MTPLLLLLLALIAVASASEGVAQEKFLDGLASLIRTGRETVTLTEQETLTQTLTSIVRVTETTIDYRTKTLSTTLSSTNSITLSYSTDTTRLLTTTETITSTRTEEIILRTTSTLTEGQDIVLNLHLRTSLFPARIVTETAVSTESLISTISSVRTQVMTLMNETTQTLTQRVLERETHWTTITMRSTATFEELVRRPRIKTVTSTRLVGAEVTVTSTVTKYGRGQHYGRIPGHRV